MRDSGLEQGDTLDGYRQGSRYRTLEAHPGVQYPDALIVPFRLRAKSKAQKEREAEKIIDPSNRLPSVDTTIGDDDTPVALARPAVYADVPSIELFVRGHVTSGDVRMRTMSAAKAGVFFTPSEITRKYGPPKGENGFGLDYVHAFAGVVVIPEAEGVPERVLGTVHAVIDGVGATSFDESFLVDSALHGKGVGGALMGMLKQWAHDNPKVTTLHGATINDEMMEVFRRNGFQAAGKDPDTEGHLFILHRASPEHPQGF